MPTPPDVQLLRLPQVLARCAISRSVLYSLMAHDQFPRPVKIGRASAWSSSEIDAWIGERIAERAA